MTRFFSPLAILILLISCKLDKKSKIERIIQRGAYTIEIDFVGDFGTGTETIEIKKNRLSSLATYTYLDYSREMDLTKNKNKYQGDKKKTSK